MRNRRKACPQCILKQSAFGILGADAARYWPHAQIPRPFLDMSVEENHRVAQFSISPFAPSGTITPDLAETRLKTSVGEFQRHLETGLIGAGKTGIKHGSAKLEIVAQGPTA